jgi:hypothetical protein
VGQHRSASASRLLGLDGFQVVSAQLVGVSAAHRPDRGHRGRLCGCGVAWQTDRSARLRGRSPRIVAKSPYPSLPEPKGLLMMTLFRRALVGVIVTGVVAFGAPQTHASAATRATEQFATAVWTLTDGCVETRIVVYSSQSAGAPENFFYLSGPGWKFVGGHAAVASGPASWAARRSRRSLRSLVV